MQMYVLGVEVLSQMAGCRIMLVFSFYWMLLIVFYLQVF